MITKKKIVAFSLIFLLLCPCFAVPSFAADDNYYMVDGRVYSDGTALINRVDIVENLPSVNINSGDADSYALTAFNQEGETIYMYVLNLNFELSAGAGGRQSAYAEFSALIPYDEEIVYFAIIDGEYNMLAEASLYDTVQTEVSYFNVEEIDGGYNLEWEIGLLDDSYRNLLEYDIMTVSTRSGETNILAYKTIEPTLFVPYEWLDPNDTIVFALKSNDSRTTLTALSDEISTPQGDEKSIADNDSDWIDLYDDDDYDDDDDYEDYDGDDDGDDGDGNDGSGDDEEMDVISYIILAVIVIVPVAIIVAVIILIRKKIKNNGKSDNGKSDKKKPDKETDKKPAKKTDDKDENKNA